MRGKWTPQVFAFSGEKWKYTCPTWIKGSAVVDKDFGVFNNMTLPIIIIIIIELNKGGVAGETKRKRETEKIQNE